MTKFAEETRTIMVLVEIGRVGVCTKNTEATEHATWLVTNQLSAVETLEKFEMTRGRNLRTALAREHNRLSEMRRRLAWALGSAMGILFISIVAVVAIVESQSTSTLPATSGLTQPEYPTRSFDDPGNDRGREPRNTLQS